MRLQGVKNQKKKSENVFHQFYLAKPVTKKLEILTNSIDMYKFELQILKMRNSTKTYLYSIFFKV